MRSFTAFAVNILVILLIITEVKLTWGSIHGDTRELIVSFKEYKDVDDHVKFLDHVFGEVIEWSEKKRENLMSGIASDFVVIIVGEGVEDVVRGLLGGREEVKMVFEEGVHRRRLMAMEEKKDYEGGLPMVRKWDDLGRGGNVLGSNVTAGVENGEGVEFPGVDLFGAEVLWKMGVHGKGVRVAVFDTGLGKDNPHFQNVVERTDWTDERKFDDKIGHGTFVAGLIAGSHPVCPGLARDAQIVAFRVFDANQISYTSWFLDAFNYAMHADIDILNLSIGGPDFADEPFTEKINELTAAGVIVVSAIGNDGPLWGSLNNPADMMEVVGVGGIEPDGRIASFSSRGMTTHELGASQFSYGRVKPDLVAYGRTLDGPSNTDHTRCKKLSGTSVASPVVAGAIALIASTVPKERRRTVVNPASIKRALLESTKRLRGSSMYEQGSGLLDIPGAAKVMKEIDAEFVESFAALRERKIGAESKTGTAFTSLRFSKYVADQSPGNGTVPGPKATLFPSFLDLTARDCSFMWPHCAQPLYAGAIPVVINVSVLNPGGVKGIVDKVEWIPDSNGELLDVSVTLPQRFWPWAGGLGVHIRAKTPPVLNPLTADGRLRIRVRSVIEGTFSDVELPISAEVITTPSRKNRVLFDMFHSLKYPPAYVPRDTLSQGKDVLDWLGDHPHTNFHVLFRQLRRAAYFVEILHVPLSCLPDDTPAHYGALFLVDSEDFFSPAEVRAVSRFVKRGGMSLIVAADWHNNEIMQDIRFEDENTRSWWTPIVGGANVPAINELLKPHGIAFGNKVVSGTLNLDTERFNFVSGTNLVAFPRGGEVLFGKGMKIHKIKKKRHLEMYNAEVPVLGICKSGSGTVVAYGDSNCLDTTETDGFCYSTFVKLLSHAINMGESESYRKKARETVILRHPLLSEDEVAEQPPASVGSLFLPHSHTFRLMKSFHQRGVTGKYAACQSFGNALTRPTTNLTERSLQPLTFSPIEYAIPLGSPDSYYKYAYGGVRRSYFNVKGDENIQGEPLPMEYDTLQGGASYASFAIKLFIGLTLLALSVAIRRSSLRRGVVLGMNRGYLRTMAVRYSRSYLDAII